MEEKVEKKKTNIKATAKQPDKKNEKAKVKSKNVATTSTKSKKTNVAKQTQSYKPENIKILGYHDLELNTYVHDNVQNAKAVVLIVHGMQEHCLRYNHFAEFLNKNGYIAVLCDLRGHGKTALSKQQLGFGEKDIFNETLQDLQNIIDYVNEKYNLPIYVFGHSYGSMLTQNLIQRCPLIEKAVMCGTANGSSTIMKLGSFVISILSPFKNKNSKGGMIEKMCIKSYGKHFERGNWLTKDEKVFDAYLADEYCGGSFPFSFYKSMIKNMTKTNKGIDKIGSKKVLFIVGDQDPVSNGGKQVTKLYKLYLKNNINANLKIYHNDRHELLNETDRDQVMQDVLAFYEE
ncbi:MAG: alpha/beta fold hydrolase [Candidatus Caccovivens sp.]